MKTVAAVLQPHDIERQDPLLDIVRELRERLSECDVVQRGRKSFRV